MMLAGAGHLLLRARLSFVRRAGLVFALAVMTQGAWGDVNFSKHWEPFLVGAHYASPTIRYPHGVLGDKIEYGSLELVYMKAYMGQRQTTVIDLPQELVFEDTAPRLVDVDGDGNREAIVVQSHRDKGARLAIYGRRGLVAATPFIGQRFRWLAPVGAADLDGDGYVEIAYVDRPHLAKVLRIVRFKDGKLTEVGSLKGLSNHRIGEREIVGGIVSCKEGQTMFLPDADWQRWMAVTFKDDTLSATEFSSYDSSKRDDLEWSIACYSF